MNKFVNNFYAALMQRRTSVGQYLNSQHGIKQLDDAYLLILNKHSINDWCELLRHKLYAQYGQEWGLNPSLKESLETLTFKKCQVISAVMYLELDQMLVQEQCKFSAGGNNRSEQESIHEAVLLAEMEMCASAIGLQGIQSSLQSAKGRKGGKKEGDLRHDLRKFCQEVGSTSWPKVKAAIKNRGIVNELRESTIDPIRLRDFRFSGSPGDRREERKEDVLHYTKRDNQPGSIKVVNVSKILSKIKKENNL